MSDWPVMRTFELTAEQPAVDDVALATRRALESVDVGSCIAPGASVAVGVGSRGIVHIDVITRHVIQALQAAGFKPFIVPAMGSHGGATAEGQAAVLARMGVTEQAMGCPIRTCMETEVIGRTGNGFPIHFDRNTLSADAVVLINRIKTHPRFVGAFESGLMKMLLVGMGKRIGALNVHRYSVRNDFQELVQTAGRIILDRVPVAFGVAVLENAFHRTALIRAVPAEAFLEVEPELQRQAKRLAPRLPVSEVDLLVVDRIGKDISGTGMDTYVIGLRPDSPTRVARIVALDLSEASGGNAQGIGFAALTTQRLLDKIDLHATRTNALTAGRPEGARLPIPLSTDRDAVRHGIDLVGGPEARIVHIRDTASLERLDASGALWAEVERHPDYRGVGEPFEMHIPS